MKHLMAALMAALVVVPAAAEARKSTYIATNHRFNYVKISEVKPSVAEARNMTHPVEIDEQGLKSALESVMLARSFVVKKEVDSQRVFNDSAVSYLAHNMSIAFAQAKPDEEVVFSYLTKDPFFILRNDRLNLGFAWISGDRLHIKFKKLYAKVTGDTDKRGNENKAVARSRGLRVQLDLQPGQMMAANDTEELILDINYNYAADVQQRQKDATTLPTHGKTMAGADVTLPAAADVPVATPPPAATKAKSKSKTVEAESASAAPGATMATTASDGAGVEQRLRKLDGLRKDGLISDKEYKEKKKEILSDL